MAPSNHRLAFLISVTVHLAIVTSLISYVSRNRPQRLEMPPPAEEVVARRIFLPPPAVLREKLPTKPPAPPPTPPPAMATPPPSRAARDRISVGDPSAGRTDKPLILRREDDLAAAPGRQPVKSATPQPSPGGADRDAALQQRPKGATEQDGAFATPSPAPSAPPARVAEGQRPGLDLPSPPRAGVSPAPAPSSPSLASSLKELEQRLASGAVGAQTGAAGRQMGPLFFDPAGADFTSWINQFKNEVYRNWIVPQAALFGFRGHVDIVFTVGRNGAIQRLEVQKSSGTPALDRAAVNALRGGRFLALPADYGPPEVTMEVTFFYGEGPLG
jgi:protein TonB